MFADWVQDDGDERLTIALVDRLSHHADIIEVQNMASEKQALTCKIFQTRLRDLILNLTYLYILAIKNVQICSIHPMAG